METCACCGYKTIEEKGCYEICPICFWEDDSVQEADPWFKGGANRPNLFEAQNNYQKFGAMEERFASNVRLTDKSDKKDELWRPLNETDKEFSTTPAVIEKVWGTKAAISYNYWERNA
jgi:hypothetical protein